MELESRKLVHYFSTRFGSDAIASSANFVRRPNNSPDEFVAVRTIALSLSSSLFHDISGVPGLFALVAFDACALVLVIVLLVFAGFLDGQKAISRTFGCAWCWSCGGALLLHFCCNGISGTRLQSACF